MRKLYVLILSAFLACISISELYAQAPGGVIGPDFWVKSDDAGIIATAWKDHSANANNIPAVGVWALSAANRAHNFHPYTTGYSGTNLFRNPTSVLNPTNGQLNNISYSIFSAVRPTTAGTGRIIGIDDDENAAEPGFSIQDGKLRLYKFTAGANADQFEEQPFNIGAVNVVSGIGNNPVAAGGTSTSAGGERVLGVNGVYKTYPNGTVGNLFHFQGQRLRIGDGAWTAPGPFPGDIMEVIWYKRALTANEQSRVNSYLAVKNGTTLNENYLASNSSVVWDRTINNGYNNNIFGIARDNTSVLHQKQAGSTNTGQQLVISTTGFANSNIANSTGLVSDLQFLLAGDNNLKQSLTTPLVYTTGANGATNYRFEAIWKVQNSGNVGTVTIAWPKGVKNLYLVQSTNTTFDATDSFTPMSTEVTVDGVVYNMANVTLADGQFFTFAGFAQAPGGVVGPDFWVKSDDAGTIGTAWKDNSFNADNIPNVGGVMLSPADRAHNFNPFTTGYSGTKYFNNLTSALNPTNGQLDDVSHSIFSAIRPTSAGTGRIVGIDDDGNAAEPGFSMEGGKLRLYKFTAGANADQFDEQPFNVGIANIVSGIGNNPIVAGGTSVSAGGERVLGVNGVYKTYPNTTSTNRFHIQGQRLRIGDGAFTAPGPFPGDIMEVVWYKRPLNANEQSRVNTYLALKNGATLNENYLATNSNVVWDRTLNNGYNNNIFGIAKDELTALHQKQSGSVNNGQQLVISTTGFADNNIANGTSLVNDMQYLIAGDNGLKQGLAIPLAYTAGTNGSANLRFEAIWKVQNTNTVGAVTVAWPKGVSNLYLVQSTDAAFDGTDTFTPMATEVTVNGVVYNTANVTLANGQFFTFAGFAQAPGGVVGPDFWVRSNDAGTIATAWKDNSPNADNIPNVGGVILSPADRAHNFHPFTTGYTSSKYFLNTASLMNPLGNVEMPNTNTSIFSAVRPTTAAGTGRIIGIDNDVTNAAEPGVSIANGEPRQFEFWQTTTSSDFSIPFNTGISNVFSAIANNTVANGGTSAIAGGEKRLGLNGSYQSFSGFASGNKFQIYGTNLILGYGSYDAAGAFPGDIMEVAWYNRLLTTNEQSRVNSYLAVKNGITSNENYLATNSNIVWDRTINTGYNNNIFGIAKDNFTALNQKQSGSVNSGQQLVISTTGFADNNIANSTSLVNDMQYLMTGDNGLKQSLAIPLVYTAGSNGVANYRFESIWKVQNTNTVGTVTVAWPKGVKNLYLVQSTDAAFDGTDTFTPMTTQVTVNGVIYNTANVTLTNGQFFTFAGFGNSPAGVATGLSYWYRADINATNTGAGTDVTGWKDLWSGTTVAQMGANGLPKYVQGANNYFNFNPGINFTAGTQSLGNTNVRTFSADSYDVFTFTKEGMTSGGAFSSIFRSLVDNAFLTGGLRRWDGLGIQMDGGIERYSNTGGTTDAGVFYPAGTFSTTIPSIMYNTFTATTTARALNGLANGATTTHGGTGVRNLNGGHIFGDSQFSGNGSDNRGFVGHLGETIVYGSGNITATERRRVDSYLAIKYGITLSRVATDHYLASTASPTSIVWNGATNPTFNNNIFGIARADIGAFEQKISTSVNAGTILTVAKDNNFVLPNDDASRTGLLEDEGYFLLGDNNVTATTFTNMTINGYTGASRIARIWLAQRTKNIGGMHFAANLSSYGGGFGSGDQVKMVIADDAAFTSNVVYVDGIYNAASGKWVHNYNFDSGNANRYITYATVNEVACTSGCNNNTYINAADPGTIEYDNIIADETTTILKKKDGSFYVWGPGTSPNVSSSNANVVLNLLEPTKIDPATTLPATGSSGNGFNYTGTPLKAALANVNHLLTTDGLYVWGNGNMYTLNTIGNTTITYRTPSGYKFGKLTVNNKADGLPPGVSPTNVKMMSGNQETLTIVTCSGAAWVLSQSTIGSVYGDGMPGSVANNSIWHRVMTSATQTLDNVVAVRGIRSTKFALTSDGKLYTWGNNTFHNNSTAAVTSNYATEISVPAGVTPKMIGMTEGNNEGEASYYLLATNGKLYAMGYNGQRQLGLGDATIRQNWTEVTATSGGNTLGGNIAWISPAENVNNLPSINVLTTSGKQWGWGRSSQGHLGVVSAGMDPTFMPGNGIGANELGLTDKVIAVKDGGQHAINFKENSTKYGFIGLNTFGSKGDGTSVAGTQELKYTYISDFDLCAITSSVTPFPCDGNTYLLKGPGTLSSSQLFKHNLATGVTDATPLVTFTGSIVANGLAFSPIDNTLWALATPVSFANKAKLTRIDGAGVVTTFDVPNLAAALGVNPTAAGITPTGYYVAKTSSSISSGVGEGDNYVVIDVDPSRATYLQIVDPTNSYALATAPYYKETFNNVAINTADFAYNPGDGLFYGVSNTHDIVKLNIETGVYAVVNAMNLSNGTLPPTATTYTSAYIDATGYLYVIDGLGKTYRISIPSGNATLISNAGAISNGDGANCLTATLAYVVQGNVFNDVNGLTDNIINGTGTNLSNTLNTILYNNTTGAVAAINPVAANGKYGFGTIPGNSYTVYITTNTATIGQTAVPVVALPFGYTHIGEYNCLNTAGCTGNDGIANGILSLGVVNADISQANFGLKSCTQPGSFDAAGLPSTTGISNLVGFTGGTTGWPANVTNGHVVIESKNKGFVITRVSSSAAILDPKEGMLIYDNAANCVKLYYDASWHCLAKSCL